jgi:hypothetical protein
LKELGNKHAESGRKTVATLRAKARMAQYSKMATGDIIRQPTRRQLRPTGNGHDRWRRFHGCFRMNDSQTIELCEKVRIGASIYVMP